MGWQRSAEDKLKFRIYVQLLVGLLLISVGRVVVADTNPSDVLAINKLNAALGSPDLIGWTSSAGDPCGDAWQGVLCDASNIVSINLSGNNLVGKLGDGLDGFTSIKQLELSNNLIAGEIPSNLPSTLEELFLSANAFTGSIPSSIATLTQLKSMSLGNNSLTGDMPDSFQTLTSLAYLDLSSNQLSGVLPPSIGNLLSLTTMHLQNNKLSGTVDVLQDLPLTELNIENNNFSGTIPVKMLTIANFKKDGNLFDAGTPLIPSPTSPTPTTSPSLRPPAPPFFKPPLSDQPPGKQIDGTPTPGESKSEKSSKKSKTTKIVLISVAATVVFLILAIACIFFMPWCFRKRQRKPRNSMVQVQSSNQIGKVQKEGVATPDDEKREPRRAAEIPKHWNENIQNEQVVDRLRPQVYQEINRSHSGTVFLPPPPPPSFPAPSPPPPPPPPPPPSALQIVVDPIVPKHVLAAEPSAKRRSIRPSVNSYTIALLQQYTGSFSQENLIGSGMLGSVYRAELPNGKILAVKKFDKKTSKLKDEEFMEMVSSIEKIRHANIVKLVGYCVEHEERLLVYDYCGNGSVQEALHSDDDDLSLSWSARVRMALEAAKALKYLHEDCQPPIIHRNFKSANVLFDDDLAVRVSDCGLAPLITSGSVSQLSGQLQATYGYGAPEYESGVYTAKSDIYSFGVVMLELLTGRKPYDSARVRGEQFLVRWAIPQLYDIDALSRMVDPSLKGEYPVKSLSHFADIVARCVQPEPEFRPPMSAVVHDLLEMIRKDPQHYRFNCV